MESLFENLAILIIFLAWILRTILSTLAKKKGKETPGPKPQPGRPKPASPERAPRPQKSAAELLRELGLDLGEPEPEPEPQRVRPASPEPSPAAPPPAPRARPGLGPRPPVRRRRRSSVLDEALPPIPIPVPVQLEVPSPQAPPGGVAAESLSFDAEEPGSRVRRELLRDLTGGPSTMQRAIVLAEILGPPTGLQSSDPASRQ